MKKLLIVLLVFLVGCSVSNNDVKQEDTINEEITENLENKDTETNQELGDNTIIEEDGDTVTSNSNQTITNDNQVNSNSNDTPPTTNDTPSSNATKTPTVAETPVVPETPTVPETPEVPPIEEEVIEYATISIVCNNILNNMDQLKPGYEQFLPSNGIFVSNYQIEINENTTALSLLEAVCKANGIVLLNSSGYIRGIGGIEEFACGSRSGWMYSVNNKYQNVGAGSRKVTANEHVQWIYTCNNGKDINFEN